MTTADRIRELAGDERAGRYARGKVRRSQRDFVRRRWRFLGGVAAAISAAVVPAAAVATNDFERGLVIGSGLTVAGATVVHFVTVLTGSGPRSMGEAAEQWTAQELRPLLSHDWRLVNHLSLQNRGDIDHVLVGPGGLYVLETKWSASPYKISPPDSMTLSAAASASREAARLSRAIPRKAAIDEAQPLVVLWGAASEHLRDETGAVAIGSTDARVIAGHRLRDWALRRGRDVLTPEQVEAVWDELDRYARYTDEREPSVPGSISEALMSVTAAVGAGLATVLAIAEAARAPHGWILAISAAALLAVSSLLLRRRVLARPFLRPVLTGTATAAAISGAIFAIAIIWELTTAGPHG